MEPVMMEPFRQNLHKGELEKSTLDHTPAAPDVDKGKNSKNFITDSDIKWLNVFALSTVHVLGLYGLWMCLTYQVKIISIIYAYLVGVFVALGVTAGAHRYYTHRSFKATKPLQLLMLAGFCMAGQNPLFEWVRDHRVHHKFSETDADPHNSHRGFFFSHVGWLMTKKHPEVKRKGKTIDMSDILNDPYVTIHRRYFILWQFLAFFIIMYLPVYLFNETMKGAFMLAMLRYIIALNITWSVNSVAHIWGYRPYDRRVKAVENKYVAMFAFGEGWHNYHHVFPWDYRASELGYNHNITTSVIDFFARIGWAYDLKQPSPDLIKAVVEKHGKESLDHVKEVDSHGKLVEEDGQEDGQEETDHKEMGDLRKRQKDTADKIHSPVDKQSQQPIDKHSRQPVDSHSQATDKHHTKRTPPVI